MFQKTVGFRVFFWASVVLIGGFVFLPLLWLINTALKPASETFSLAFFSGPMTLDNLRGIVTDPKIMRYLLNSLVVSFASSFLATAVCAFAGYSFSQCRYRGRKFVLGLFMMSQAFPQASLLVSLYVLMQKLGLLGSYYALMISYVVFTLPVGTWTLKTYFDQLPDSLIESAKIDGAGVLTIYARLILPMSMPIIACLIVFCAVNQWNAWSDNFYLVSDPKLSTLQYQLYMNLANESSNVTNTTSSSSLLRSKATTELGLRYALSMLTVLPIILVYPFMQKYFVKGIMLGAVKG